jgi:hypothetical protein
MKISVVSYSLTGNNEALAARVARSLGADHLKVAEHKPRSMGAIALDMLFNRTPKVGLPADALAKPEALVFFAPVWMGKVASPLRASLKALRADSRPYAFVSISGGSAGTDATQRLADDVKARTGRAPAIVVDLHIADLLPREPKPTRETTSAYKLTEADIEKLAAKTVEALKGKIG